MDSSNIPTTEEVAELLRSTGMDQQQIEAILDHPLEQSSVEQSSKTAEDKLDRVLDMVTGLSQRLTRLEKAEPSTEEQASLPGPSTPQP